jgi:hypothetical protein
VPLCTCEHNLSARVTMATTTIKMHFTVLVRFRVYDGCVLSPARGDSSNEVRLLLSVILKKDKGIGFNSTIE